LPRKKTSRVAAAPRHAAYEDMRYAALCAPLLPRVASRAQHAARHYARDDERERASAHAKMPCFMLRVTLAYAA